MKKFIAVTMAISMVLSSVSYGAVINPQKNDNIVNANTKTDDTNAQCDVIKAYLKSEGVADAILKEHRENTKKSSTDASYEVEGGNIYFNKATGLITGADSTVTKVSIPLYIDKTLVLGIDDYAFFNCPNLIEVTMRNELKTIGKKAFAFSGLKKITLSEKLISIGEKCFYYSPLTSVKIPDTVAAMGIGAFEQSALNTVTVPKSVTAVPESCFEGCSSLKTAGINTGAKTLEKNAFKGCSSLVTITIPKNVETIGESAFDGCTKLFTVNFNAGLKHIKPMAFANTTALTSVSFPHTLTELDGTSFNGSGLKSVTCYNKNVACNRTLYPSGVSVKTVARIYAEQ